MAEEIAISVLLLGDDVGKSTFVSRLSLGVASKPTDILPELRDDDQPFIFNISPPAKRDVTYRIEISDTSSPENFNLLKPHVVVLCYSVASRRSLRSVQACWKPLVETHYSIDERTPTMLLGLQRDLRPAKFASQPLPGLQPAPKARGGFEEVDEGEVDRAVLPQEGLAIAQEMRCDRYAECSAVTGELCQLVFEDLVRLAVRSITKGPGEAKSDGSACAIM